LETAVQPARSGCWVVPVFDRLFQDVGEVPAETAHFLLEPGCHPGHQIAVTLIPHVVVAEGLRHTAARRFDSVLADDLGIEWGKLAPPVDDLCSVERG